MKFINLTSHSIDIYRDNRKVLSIEPSGVILRVPIVKSRNTTINSFPLYTIKYKLPNLPKPEKNTYYIVSTTVLQVMKINGIHRDDIIAPDTDEPVRDRNGKIIGVKGFVRIR